MKSFHFQKLTKLSFSTQTLKMSNNNTSNQPSMIGGHAQYAKGYAEETIGNVTGSKEWQDSGKKDAQAGIDEMKVRYFSLPQAYSSSLDFVCMVLSVSRLKITTGCKPAEDFRASGEWSWRSS